MVIRHTIKRLSLGGVFLDRFKCHVCKLVIDSVDLEDGKCPICGREPAKMCELDHLRCSHDVAAGVAFCPKCGEPACPVCGCHDVAQISRVTGYLQEVSGWNSGKLQELKDRHRYDIAIG